VPVTPSEQYLAGLCQQAFLSLWSHPNVYTDAKKPPGKGVGRELCDLLVVFGDDVLIFSDKHIEFKAAAGIDVAWRRWYREAIEKSVGQLHGAHSWITRFPDRIYLDPECAKKFPIAFPPADRIKIHRIAVTRGAYAACREHFGGNSIGSLRINTGISGAEAPFTVGLVGDSRGFVHVMDEVTLEAVFTELDTVSDFVAYLRKKEAFLSDASRVIVAAGEEQLLAIYLTHLNTQGDHDIVLPEKAPEAPNPDLVMFDESFWRSMTANPAYISKKQADEISYVWDKLIDQFISKATSDLVPGIPDAFKGDIEPAVRAMASESRLRRRLLGDSLISLMKRLEVDRARARVVHSSTDGERVYVLLALPFLKSFSDYTEYRQHRAAVLTAYCKVARLSAPDSKEVVGIGFDAPSSRQRGGSEDLLFIYEPTFTAELRKEAEDLQKQFNLLNSSRLERTERHYEEYPVELGHIASKHTDRRTATPVADSVARELFGRPPANRAERRKLEKARRRRK
jgi:hypothetical protein